MRAVLVSFCHGCSKLCLKYAISNCMCYKCAYHAYGVQVQEDLHYDSILLIL